MTRRHPTHAGGVVYRMSGGAPEFLLVTARSPRLEWVYPKGHIDAGEDAAQAAVREVEEEAGVHATIVRLLDDVEAHVGEEVQIVRYFLMTATDAGEPREGRRSIWVRAEDALRHLTFPESRECLRLAVSLMSDAR